MKLKKVLLGFSLLLSAVSFAQQSQKEVLFTINDKPYYTDEFIRIYNKNLDLVKDDSQKDLNNYLDLFIGYKLKVNKAYKLGIQNDRKYQSELRSYRNQLSKNYLTDTEVTKELIEEAYKRSLKEIRASHILFLVNENALPADTLKAYNKAVDVRKKAMAGQDFGKLAAQYSEDPSAKENKGDLGYFSTFSMVYPFETGAYTTPKGQISMPVRTKFGYHLIKVADIRDNRGDIVVAHIMIAKTKDSSPEEIAKTKTTIDEIYQKLKQGEDFATLAKQFSQDTYSAGKGGVLDRFSSGSLNLEAFEDHSFELKNPGDFSQPFETDLGWHIVKLVEKFPVKTFEASQADLENRIKKDDRSKIIAEAMTEKLKKKYSVKKDDKVYVKTVKPVTEALYAKSWSLPVKLADYDQTILVINNDKKIAGWAFLEYVNNQQKANLGIKPLSKQLSVLFDKFADEQLNVYYNENLENEFPEFNMVMEEYRDGLLLFELMEREIFDKSKSDTIGLASYYKAHLNNYQWEDRVNADVYSSTDKNVIKKAQKYLKKGKDSAYIKEELNTADKVNVIENSGVFEQKSNALPKQDEWKEGVSDVIEDGEYFYVVKTNKVLPKGPKTLDECKGRVINDYQQYLESTWVDELEKEFTVKVNQDVFAKVKKQLNQ